MEKVGVLSMQRIANYGSFLQAYDNIPTLMAVANDIGYEEVFRFPLENKMKSGDILIGISGSGNSKNVVNAIEYAKSIGGTTTIFELARKYQKHNR